jgi:hypothetical protein
VDKVTTLLHNEGVTVMPDFLDSLPAWDPPQRELFAHIRGPWDGAELLVTVDKDGVPAEFNVATSPGLGQDETMLGHEPVKDVWYDREEQLDADGNTIYVFVYRGEQER